MKRNVSETLVGAAILIVAAFFLMFAYLKADIQKHNKTYKLKAKFERIDGVFVGSEVRLAGIRIGSVTSQVIDPESYLAVIEIAINDNIKLPKDSSMQITSDGLLGSKFVNLVAGADNDMLKAGEEISYTQSSFSIETLIGKMIFNSNSDKKEDKKD